MSSRARCCRCASSVPPPGPRPPAPAGRHLGYVPLGAAVVVRRLWDSRTAARYERWMRAAEAAGDLDKVLALEERLAEFRRDRHQRRVDMIEVPAHLLMQLPKLAFSVFLILGGTGVLLGVATRKLAEVAVPFEVTARIAGWVIIAFSVAWGPLLLAAPWVATGVLYWAGRGAASAGTAPRWAATSASPDLDVSIDETTITRALDALRIQQITGYLKDGVPLQYLTPCRRDGRGTHAVIRLPSGVPAERIARRRADFASGRLPARERGVADHRRGRGDPRRVDSRQGRAQRGRRAVPAGWRRVHRRVQGGCRSGRRCAATRSKLPVDRAGTRSAAGSRSRASPAPPASSPAGYALDITTEIRIYVPDTNFDFEVFRPRLSRYVMGAEDEHIEQILGELEELKDELQERGQILVDHEQPEVTRQLAAAGIGLHPLFVLLEEAHVAIQHKKHGKDISGLLCDIVKLDRKRGVHFKLSTQAPTSDSMPRDVTRNCSNGIAFAVGDHVANDALLGQGAYRAGHRATDLIPGTDQGTALCKGFSGQRSEIVQVHFLSVARGSDQVTPLIQRSLEEMARQGRGVPGGGSRPRAIESRDLLADLGEVLAHERVRLADLPALLRDLAPGWGPYRALTGVRLKELLDAEGVRVVTKANVSRLDPADLRHALARRGTAMDEG